MDYSPNDYNSILKKATELSDHISDLSSIKYNSSNDEAADDVKEIEASVEKIKNKIENANTIDDEILSLIQSDFYQKRKIYCELVLAQYEEEVFPFYDWITIDFKAWEIDKYWLENFTEISKTISGNILFVQNIAYFEETAKSYTKKSSFEIFKMCFNALNSKDQIFTEQQKKEVLERFIFEQPIDSFLYSIGNGKVIDTIEKKLPKSNDKLISYINELFENVEKNEQKIVGIMKTLSQQKAQAEYPQFIMDFTNRITDIIEGNNFLIKKNKSIYNHEFTHRYNSFIRLFEADIDNDLGITPYLVERLSKLEDNVDKSKKEDFRNMIIEIENGHTAYKLSYSLPNKETTKNKKKI